MENYIVSARKYRPLTFESVIGQEAITITLKNAIKNKHLAQSYLFCGPRGVGKTTCARIFAKTINCFNLTNDFEPCGVCESCKSFNESRSFNIHELDAASNNKVDDIRYLIEQVRIPPQIGKYSVYIIDEVHMLSLAAFNAFLKTLEEPPAHAIFILATTEKHKIIPTILSRCQIFDFNRIKASDIVKYLEYVAKNEGIQAEAEALNIIALKADGAMRDALSIFDQIVSFVGNTITYKDIITSLNVLDYDYYFKLTNAFLHHNVSDAFLIFNEILNKGFNAHNFLIGLSEHFRNLLVCKDKQTAELLEVGASIRENYLNQSSQCSTDFLFQALQLCNKCDIQFASSVNQRLHIEFTLFQLSNIGKQPDTIQAKPFGSTTTEPLITKEPEKKNFTKTVTTSSTATEKPIILPSSEKTYKTTTVSIKNILKGNAATISDNNAKANDLNNSDPENSLPLTTENLHSVWLNFADSIKEKEPQLYNAITSTTMPVIKEENLIEISLQNTLQQEFVNEKKNDILLYLKRKFNTDIQFIAKVPEIADEKKIYTDHEKFDYLSKKNETLIMLKTQLNLDFE